MAPYTLRIDAEIFACADALRPDYWRARISTTVATLAAVLADAPVPEDVRSALLNRCTEIGVSANNLERMTRGAMPLVSEDTGETVPEYFRRVQSAQSASVFTMGADGNPVPLPESTRGAVTAALIAAGAPGWGPPVPGALETESGPETAVGAPETETGNGSGGAKVPAKPKPGNPPGSGGAAAPLPPILRP